MRCASACWRSGPGLRADRPSDQRAARRRATCPIRHPVPSRACAQVFQVGKRVCCRQAVRKVLLDGGRCLGFSAWSRHPLPSGCSAAVAVHEPFTKMGRSTSRSSRSPLPTTAGPIGAFAWTSGRSKDHPHARCRPDAGEGQCGTLWMKEERNEDHSIEFDGGGGRVRGQA
jgi:hypothetical protein